MAYFDILIKFKKEAAMAKPSQNHAQKSSKFVKQNYRKTISKVEQRGGKSENHEQ